MAESLPLTGSGILLELWSTSTEDDFCVRKICVAARLADIDMTVATGKSKAELESIAPHAKGLALKVSRVSRLEDEVVTQSNAILRAIASMKPDALLYGRTDFESAQVDQWLDICWNEFEVPCLAIAEESSNHRVVTEAKRTLKVFLATVNTHLATRTFLAAERATVADVALVCAARDVFESSVGVLDPEDLAGIPHVLRWYRTVIHLSAFSPPPSSQGTRASVPTYAPKKKTSQKSTKQTTAAGKEDRNSRELPASRVGAVSGAEAAAAPAGIDATPVLSVDGDLQRSCSVVVRPKKLELAPALFRRKRLRVKELLESGTASAGQKALVKGWLRTSRSAGKGTILFLVIDDGSCAETVQVVVAKDAVGFDAVSNCGGVGASVSVFGQVVASKGKGQDVEIKAEEVQVLGSVFEPDGAVGGSTYPLAKKAHSQEFLRSIAHLRPRTKMHSAAMRVRHALAFATHQFFNDRGFLYIHTPIITGADCEGAGEQFVVSTLLSEDGSAHGGPPMTSAGHVDYSKDFFSRRTYLTVSGQLNVETHCCGLGDVYTFGPTFRAENSHTSRHLSEFWMIEPEIAFADLQDDMDLAEDYLKYLVAYVLAHCQADLQYFETCQGGERGLRDRLRNVLSNQFVRMTYTELVELVRKDAIDGKVKFSVIPEWGDDLGSEHERYVSEKVYNCPCIVTDYPKDIKAFYMKVNPDGKTVAAMDILVPKIGEIIGGSQREDDFEKLSVRAKEMNLHEDSMSWYLDLRRYGTIQHAGFGLGFERLVMFTTGIENIRDVIPFPRYPGHSEF